MTLASLSLASVRDVDVPPSVYFSGGLGEGDELIFSVGHKKAEDKSIYSGLYVSISDGAKGLKAKSIGIIGFNLNSLLLDNWGGEMTAALGESSFGKYQRSGFELGVKLFKEVEQDLRFYAGVNVRPTALSFNWENNVAGEVVTEIGLNLEVIDGAAIGVRHKANNFLENNFELSHISNDLQLFFSVVW